MSRGDTETTELYGELLLPLLQGKPGARSVNLELGYRTSDNDPSEDVDSYKALLDWRIADRIRFRGGRQTANRAPNIAELFQSAEQLFVGSSRGDWCSDLNPGNPLSPNPALNPNAAQARAICEALMGPAAAQVYYSNPNRPDGFTQFRWVNLVGNPDLLTEVAETTTAGIVAEITDSTRLTVDYWRIEISDMISAQNIDAIHATCFDPVTNPTFDPNHPACQQIGRDPFDGGQSPHTAFYTNQGAIDTSGVDIQVDWAGAVGPGQLSLNFLATFVNEMMTRPTPESDWTDWKGSSGPSDLTGVQGFAYDYRTLSTIAYSQGPWTASLRWRHLPSIESEGIIVNPAGTQVPTASYDVFDVSGRYAVNGRWEVRYGIDNLFDTDPEITFADHTTTAAGSTNANFYDILGRRYYLGLNVSF
jgi:outer membrane receptor protein involved in Fe transport